MTLKGLIQICMTSRCCICQMNEMCVVMFNLDEALERYFKAEERVGSLYRQLYRFEQGGWRSMYFDPSPELERVVIRMTRARNIRIQVENLLFIIEKHLNQVMGYSEQPAIEAEIEENLQKLENLIKF